MVDINICFATHAQCYLRLELSALTKNANIKGQSLKCLNFRNGDKYSVHILFYYWDLIG